MGSISATPLAKQIAKQKGISLGKVSPGNGRTYIIAKDVRALSTVRSTPAARRLAKQRRTFPPQLKFTVCPESNA